MKKTLRFFLSTKLYAAGCLGIAMHLLPSTKTLLWTLLLPLELPRPLLPRLSLVHLGFSVHLCTVFWLYTLTNCRMCRGLEVTQQLEPCCLVSC